MAFELGVLTFGELTTDITTGEMPSPAERINETLEQARVAEQAGLDVFGVGEHHRADFVASAPHMILAAIAMQTESIQLTSGVTVLSSDDPVRVFENFATLDLLSNGRAEIIAGRGSYTESFPLFGYNLADYSELFREKLDALLAIRSTNPVTWTEGSLRAPLIEADIAPRPINELPIWVGVGGTPASAIRTGQLGLPMALALLLGPITGMQQAAALYRQAYAQSGHPLESPRMSLNLHGFVGPTSQSARDTMYPAFARGMRENNHQRGEGFTIPRRAFDAQASAGGALLVGSPQEVIDKIMTYHEVYGIDRLVVQMGFGGVSQADHLNAIELLGTEVAPVVRSEIASHEEAVA